MGGLAGDQFTHAPGLLLPGSAFPGLSAAVYARIDGVLMCSHTISSNVRPSTVRYKHKQVGGARQSFEATEHTAQHASNFVIAYRCT